MKIINETGSNDTIYAGIVNKCEYVMYWYNGFHQLKKYPLVLQKGDHYEETIYACAGAFTTIKWGKVNIQGVAPVDSVLIAGNDTSYYTIKY